MEFNIEIALLTIISNTAICSTQPICNWIDITRGKVMLPGTWIPGTDQRFLGWNDFHTQTWGDLVGLALILVGFAHLINNGLITKDQLLVMILLTGVAMIGFFLMCIGPNHKPDWGYPEIGKISLGGLSHLPYFGAMTAIAIMCVYHIIIGNLRGPLMWIALAGGAIYIASFITDLKAGNFDPIKYIEDPVKLL